MLVFIARTALQPSCCTQMVHLRKARYSFGELSFLNLLLQPALPAGNLSDLRSAQNPAPANLA